MGKTSSLAALMVFLLTASVALADEAAPDRDAAEAPPERTGFWAPPPEFASPHGQPGTGGPTLCVGTTPVTETLAAQLRLTPGLGLVVDNLGNDDDNPAYKAGLRTNDVLLKLDDQLLLNPPQLDALVQALYKPGDTVTLTILHQGKEQTIPVNVVTADWPPSGLSGYFGACVDYLPGTGMERLAGPRNRLGPITPEAKAEAETETKVAYLGVATSYVTETLRDQLGLPPGMGLVVELVGPDSPAAQAGLRRHDLLVRLDDQRLVNLPQLAVLVRMHQPGDKVTLTLLRGGEELKVPVTLGETVLRDVVLPGDVAQRLGTGSPRLGFLRASSITFSDREHLLTLSHPNDQKYLVAKDRASGQVLFEGPIQTDEERAKVPPAILKKLERLEQVVQPKVVSRLPIVRLDDGVHNLILTWVGHTRYLLAKDSRTGQVLFDGPIDTEERLDAVPEVIREKLKTIKPLVYLPAPDGAPALHSNDEHYDLTVTQRDGQLYLLAKDRPANQTIFDGPIDTEEQLNTVPEAIRDKVRGMRQSFPRPSAPDAPDSSM